MTVLPVLPGILL